MFWIKLKKVLTKYCPIRRFGKESCINCPFSKLLHRKNGTKN